MMKTELLSLLQMKNFFNIINISNSVVKYQIKDASQKLMKNIYLNWLKFMNDKTGKNMTVYINPNVENLRNKKLPFGTVTVKLPKYSEETLFNQKLGYCVPDNDRKIHFSIFLPQDGVIQQFVKWQRYRKFWWSSVTTTPSLFKIDDIQQEGRESKVNIVAQFPFGSQPVECISVSSNDSLSVYKNCSLLKCTMSLEGALISLLFDACTNYSKDRYLRLHRKMAPYKFAITFDSEGITNTKDLVELATLLQQKLRLRKISALLSQYSLPLNSQIAETLTMGIPYTAILDKTTLENGIFKLLNSSTMLKEQVHVADFDSYAADLFSGK